MSGELPEYYQPAKAALYWGISPDEAINLPVYWIEVANNILTAENSVREKLDKSRKG